MALTQAEIAEAAALTRRIERGSVTREDWSNLVALILLAQPPEAVAAIVVGGFSAFLRTAAPILEGHAFKHDDYRRIYDRICQSVALAIAEKRLVAAGA